MYEVSIVIDYKYVVKVRREITSVVYNVTCNISSTRIVNVLLAKSLQFKTKR